MNNARYFLGIIFFSATFCKVGAMDQPQANPDKKEGTPRKWCSHVNGMNRDFFDAHNLEGQNPNDFHYGHEKATALIQVCKSDEQDTLKCLKIERLCKCGDIKHNEQDLHGNTALHYACMKRNYLVIRVLMDLSDIDLFIKNNAGQTPLKLLKKEKKFVEKEVAWLPDQSGLTEISKIIDLFQKRFDEFKSQDSVKK